MYSVPIYLILVCLWILYIYVFITACEPSVYEAPTATAIPRLGTPYKAINTPQLYTIIFKESPHPPRIRGREGYTIASYRYAPNGQHSYRFFVRKQFQCTEGEEETEWMDEKWERSHQNRQSRSQATSLGLRLADSMKNVLYRRLLTAQYRYRYTISNVTITFVQLTRIFNQSYLG